MGCGSSIESATCDASRPELLAKGLDVSAGIKPLPSTASTDPLNSIAAAKADAHKRSIDTSVKSVASLRSPSVVTPQEQNLLAVKANLVKEWGPEYCPADVLPPHDSPEVASERATQVTLAMVLKHQPHVARKTKIVCTAGPACWSEEMLGKLLDSGLNVLRLNFSHGDHQGHYEVLERFRKVCKAKGSLAAALLDTKGPEIRTAMLRGGKDIELVAGQSITVEAVGDRYTQFEGYKDEATGETRIGLSYAKLCESMKPGNRILLADGSISIKVEQVLSATELRGTVMNSKKLGQRKNCNLPGVKVDIPVLTAKDVEDLQQFAAKHRMDFVAASFVQSKADVQFIRRILDEAGGQHIKIISKIENYEGLANFDEILEVTDGIMVARGDLGMEIPSEKVPVAQKLMITKCNIAGKICICATQMLESMINNPRPTRAEMTDVANAVYDGVDCVMLSGETANGDFPDVAVSTMAAIVANAETGVDYYSGHLFIRFWATKGGSLAMSSAESILSSAAAMTVGFHEDTTPEILKPRRDNPNSTLDMLIVCLSDNGLAPHLVAKYRPPCPTVVLSMDEQVLRQASVVFGLIPLKVDSLALTDQQAAEWAAEKVVKLLGQSSAVGCKIVVARGKAGGSADMDPVVTVVKLGPALKKDKAWGASSTLMLPAGHQVSRTGVRSLRSTLTSLPLISAPVTSYRKTKIICTMGPSCWSEETLGKLLDAGMDLARFNFSHGDHKGHFEVLERFRKVCHNKAQSLAKQGKLVEGPRWAALLDTKGPEIRTAMLRGGKDIELVAGQSITVEAVGDRYTQFEGYKDEATGETRIGLSYAKLCESMKPGNRILLADGSISIKVEQVLSATELRGTVMNSKKLGQRKNCNLPGVKVDIPVLTAKDIEDLQQFAAKHDLDFVAASFVQSAEDVRFIRSTLDDAGGHRVKIISKIENAEGLENYDGILRESDGIMVARGDLGMEIPAEKVPLAQKWMITKANIAGKFIITATQMLESMINNPRPTRAEMTDVANAVLDGTDAVMLSGETANGDFPDQAVSTMSAICQNAEEMVAVTKRYNFLRNQTPKPMLGAEAVCSGAVQTAIDSNAKAIVCITASGRAPALVAKYRSPVPVIVVTPDEQFVRHCRSVYGLVGMLYNNLEDDFGHIMREVQVFARSLGVVDLQDGDSVVLLKRRKIEKGQKVPYDDQRLIMKAMVLGVGRPASGIVHTAYAGKRIIYHRSTKLAMDTIIADTKYTHFMRKTKIVCTAGPACWSEEMLGKLLDAGMNILRLNFSHGDHKGHHEVLERYRQVCKAKGSLAAALLDTKGPEIRTAMLRGGKDIELVAGQSITVEAVGDRYTQFEGYKDEATGETRIGLSYAKLCESMKPGNRILLADGSISIKVEQVLSATELRGTVMNSKKLGQRKNCNLPGVKVDIPVLTAKDIEDLQQFAAKHRMDFVAASFVQSKADVQFIRRILDEAGGQHIKIISKIENAEGLANFDEILEVTDGIMVARGDLGMEIPVEKVPLAQKWMITKANIAGKFIITATQMMESMINNPLPTRAEMTDVANAVIDGTDAVMLSGESANGAFPDTAVATMARICRSAEIGTNVYQTFDFIRTFTPKPIPTIEAVCCALAKNAVDIRPGMIVIFSENGKTPRLLAKYRPPAPVLVVTANFTLARSCSSLFAMFPMLLDKPIKGVEELPGLMERALKFGVDSGLCSAGKEVVVLSSTSVAKANNDASEALLQREMFVTLAPGNLDLESLGALAPTSSDQNPRLAAKTITLRSTVIDLDMIMGGHAPPRKTKIAATIGPASMSPEVLEKLVDAGMDMARFKFSHATPTTNAETVTTLRKICQEKQRRVAIIMDLQGPEIRTSFLVDYSTKKRTPKIELKAGEKVKLYGTDDLSEDTFVGYRTTDGGVRLGVDLPDVAVVVKKGTCLHLMDGAIALEVVNVVPGKHIDCTVRNGGTLGERKVLHFAGLSVHSVSSSMQDLADVQNFAVQYGVDYVAASQVNGRSDIESLRNFLDDCGGESIRIIAKIETVAGLRHFDEILEVADGIMLARGALGLSIPSEKVALAQAKVTTMCKLAGKPLIVARHMLETMVSNPRPTRAEMTDVANAVLDSADCLMLCSETSSGAFPVDSFTTMSQICRNAEGAMNYQVIHSFIRDFSAKPFNTLEAAAVSLAAGATEANHVGLAIVVSNNGQAAAVVSKYRPAVPLVVVSTRASTLSQCCLTFGQLGFPATESDLADLGGAEALVARVRAWAADQGLYKPEQRVLVMHGTVTLDAEHTALIQMVG
ncbi:pyruvate kinase [Haematococcus lacustris]